jgi:hypothetical protein
MVLLAGAEARKDEAMKFDENLWAKRQYGFLVEFVHQLAYYRKLHGAYGRLAVKSEFCTRTLDAYLLRCVALWCMVFGANGNEIHWKKVLLGEAEREAFRKRRHDHLGLDDELWSQYWESMRTFRNHYAAHVKAGGPHPALPDMSLALAVAEQYDDQVRSLIDASFDEPELRVRYERLVQLDDKRFEEIVRLGPSLDLPGPIVLG